MSLLNDFWTMAESDRTASFDVEMSPAVEMAPANTNGGTEGERETNAVLPRLNQASNGEFRFAEDSEFVSNEAGGVEDSKQMPYASVVIAWIVFVAIVGGSLIYALFERDGRAGARWTDCVFVALNAVTATGLSTVDMTALRWESLVMVGLCMQLGAATIQSLVPIVLRIRALDRILPRLQEINEDPAPALNLFSSASKSARNILSSNTRRPDGSGGTSRAVFDLRRYKRVPQWLVEYKALVFLARIICIYHIFVYLFYGGLLALVVAYSPAAFSASQASMDISPTAWSFFHVLSAFNNCGFSLQQDGFAGFVQTPVVLGLVNMLILHGNVLYPPCIRWIIVAFSANASKTSNRKIYLRYLLIHGRRLTPCLFSSQQNWFLVAVQLAMFVFQLVVSLSLNWNCVAYKGYNFSDKFNVAAFEAINSRHAGMTAVPLSGLQAASLMLLLIMMYLAPVPFVVVLRNSNPSHARQGSEVLEVEPKGPFGGGPDAFQLSQRSAEARRRWPQAQLEGRRISLSRGPTSPPARQIPPSPRSPHCDDMIDTRELLYQRFPLSSPPWRDRIALRASALGFHLRRGFHAARAETGFARNAMYLFLAWFVIAALMDYEADSGRDVLFYIIFELISSFGNVGLSLGSIKQPSSPASFVKDLNTASLLIVGIVTVFGRTRDMPARVDSALSLPTIDTEDVFHASQVASLPDNRAKQPAVHASEQGVEMHGPPGDTLQHADENGDGGDYHMLSDKRPPPPRLPYLMH